jgi:cephalosporin hydroxylase
LSETRPTQPKLALTAEGESRSVDLYSPEGLELLGQLWVKVAAEFRVMYEPRWMGIPIIQFPEDILMMQELLWKVRPDWIVECGVAHGGSAVFYASILELLGNGRVLGVDVEIREHNRKAIEANPLVERIELIEGSSIDTGVAAEVRSRVSNAKSVMVVLDSNHSREHVLREMELYCDLVTPGSYLVVMDGAQAYVSDIPRGKKEWRDDNPLVAIRQFLKTHPEFKSDPHYTRMHITSNPEGYLRKDMAGK